MKKIYTLLFALVMTGLGFGQTTVSYDFSSGGAVSGFNEPSPGISLDANIGFSSFRNSGTSDPGIFSNQLRLYQNATKGGSIIIYASNGVTITNIVVNASSRMGDAGYTVDGGSQVNLSGGSTYTISGINATSQVEFFQRESGSGNRIYVDSFDVTYTSVASCTAPTIAATAFAESGVTTNSATLSWARGDGDNVIVIMKEGAAVDFSPESETTYTANAAFASGTELGTGNYVVYDGSGTSVAVTGLTQNETYHIAVYEYNTTDTCYLTPALTGSFTTECSTPSEVNTFTATAGNEEVDLTWSNGSCYDEILVIAKETSAVTVTPTGDGSAYTANTAFGSGSDVGSSEFVVYKGTGTSATVTGLTNGNTYHFSVFTRKATSWSAAVVDDATLDCTAPAIQASTFTTLSPTTTDVSIEFTRGGGDDVLVVMKEGSAVDTDPTSGISYNANSIFNGAGASEIGTGNYVVFNGNNGTSNPGTGGSSLSISVSGLNPNTTYHLAIYEYNTINTCYNLTEFTGDFTTVCSTPSDVTAFTAEEGTTEVDLTWSNGSCFDEILVIAKETSAVTVTPTGDGTAYTADAAFGSGSDVGTDEYVVYKGTGTSVTVTGLTNGTTYHFEVFARKATTWSTGVTANAVPDLTWCTVSGTTTYDTSITLVNFGTINKSSGQGSGYDDFTAESTDAIQGSDIDLTVNLNTDGPYTIYAKAWIDWNQDGTFDTSTEEYALGTANDETDGPTTLSPLTISVPAGATLGNTRMRVSCQYGSYPGACTGSTDGEIEDYTINIIPATTDTLVQFTSASTTVAEDAGTYDLEFSITNEDSVNATTFDVVLISGDNADIDGYTTQTVTFVAGSSTNQTVTVTITDDAIIEGDETLTFEIQNVTGGSSASASSLDSFDLTISASDAIIPAAGDLVISEIMYNSLNTDDEWIEIYNASGNDITLDSDWELNYGSNSFDFSGTIITAGSYLTIALGSNGDGTFNNENPFTPDVSTIATPAATASTDNTNNITNSSATISIVFDPSGDDITIDTVTYDDSTPWPNAADGDGPSLELADLASDNSLGSNWVASDNFGGTPGTGYSVTYTFTGSWSPSNPNGVATADDNIVIASGDAIIDTNTTANSVTVSPGASLTVNSSVTLTVNSTEGLLLNSTSTSYSSLILDGTIAGTVKYNRYVNYNDSVNGNDLISAPLSGQAFNTFIANNPNIRANPSGPEVLFGGFDNNSSTDPFELWNDTDTTPLTAGKGYRSGIAEDQASNLVTFEGTVNTSLVQIPINQGSESTLNLIGNPFPSYLDAQEFLSHNSGLLDPSAAVIYGYNDSTDGTSADDYTIISALLNTSMNIAPGQAFFVSSNTTGGNIEFTTSGSDMRLATGGDDFIAGRNSSVISNLKLNLSNTNANFITDIFFTQYSTQGLDPGYDASLLGGVAPAFALYSHLVEDNTDVPLAVQALGKTDYMDITIPLGVNANQGEQIIFSINETNLANTVEVYLEDNVTNTSTLLNTSDYTLTPNVDLSGTGRFYLRVTDNSLSISDNSLDNLNIYNNQKDKTVVISGQLAETTTAKLYDIQGRTVSTSLLQNLNSLQTIDVSGLKAGVYVVQLVNGTQNKTQKIIIR
ncbi:GEVED domain-containing protein [Winogradskyella damuponensis]|uniref:Por secretion system C-terminal sorting domain-containing protein n=1 Tax=Winogradskyella damuponensis TaxID=943939 RepID=A0ABP8CWG3_9FLAO